MQKNEEWVAVTTPPLKHSNGDFRSGLSAGSTGSGSSSGSRKKARSLSPKRGWNSNNSKNSSNYSGGGGGGIQSRDVTPVRNNSSGSHSKSSSHYSSNNNKTKTRSGGAVSSSNNSYSSKHSSGSSRKNKNSKSMSPKRGTRGPHPSPSSPLSSWGGRLKTNKRWVSPPARKNSDASSGSAKSANTTASNTSYCSNNSHSNHSYHACGWSERAVRFPPDPNEPGIDVINRIYRSCGLSDKFPKDCQDQVKKLVRDWNEHHGNAYAAQKEQKKQQQQRYKSLDDENVWKPKKQREKLKKEKEKQQREQQDQLQESKLSDTTHIPYITIDNDNTTDLDQAMYITYLKDGLSTIPLLQNHNDEKRDDDDDGSESSIGSGGGSGTGCYWVSYGLADGAHFCPAFTPLFENALNRGGSTFYLPGKSVPMLPKELSGSNGVMGLNPDQPTRALVFDVYVDEKTGKVLKTFYKWSIIKSLWKGSYREVADYYDYVDSKSNNDNKSKSSNDNISDNNDSTTTAKSSWLENQKYKETLDLLRVVALKRIELANENNFVDLNHHHGNDDGGTGIVIDRTTGLLTFKARGVKQRYASEEYNEQISLLCNTEGAKILAFLDELEEKSIASKAKVHSLPPKNLSLSMRSKMSSASSAGSRRSLLSETTPTKILHPIFRTQDAPHQFQIRMLEDVIVRTLKANEFDVDKWSWHRHRSSGCKNNNNNRNDDDNNNGGGETLACYLDRLRSYKRFLELDAAGSSAHKLKGWEGVLSVIERQAKLTNRAANFTTDPINAGHHSLKLSHYARFSSPMRELVGCFLHKELWEARTGQFVTNKLSPERDVLLRDDVIRAATKAKEIQKRLSSMVFLHMLNTLFYKDLQCHLDKRKIYKGMMMGMDFSEKEKSRRCYVRLEDPSGIEIKVYADDLDYHYNCRYGPVGEAFNQWGGAISIAPMPGSYSRDACHETPPTFHAGCRVTIRVGDYAQFYGQASRSRWIFIMKPEEIERKQNSTDVRLSLRRNSIIDRDYILNSIHRSSRGRSHHNNNNDDDDNSLLSDLTERSESITEFSVSERTDDLFSDWPALA